MVRAGSFGARVVDARAGGRHGVRFCVCVRAEELRHRNRDGPATPHAGPFLFVKAENGNSRIGKRWHNNSGREIPRYGTPLGMTKIEVGRRSIVGTHPFCKKRRKDGAPSRFGGRGVRSVTDGLRRPSPLRRRAGTSEDPPLQGLADSPGKRSFVRAPTGCGGLVGGDGARFGPVANGGDFFGAGDAEGLRRLHFGEKDFGRQLLLLAEGGI